MRFDAEMEIALFKEVINVVPYNMDGSESTEAWRVVGENVRLATGCEAPVSSHTARQKVEMQLKYFRCNNKKNLKKLVFISNVQNMS